MRYALGLQYDGTHFHGYQAQGHDGLRTVQGSLDFALSQVADGPIISTCAGRTDAGVHAAGQVVHFDTEAQRADHAWLMGTNSHLPEDVSVTWVKAVPEDFHARYNAIARRYRYTIYNAPHRQALQSRFATWYRRPLDVAKMHQAAQSLLGEYDFSAFRGVGCQSKSPVREVQAISLQRCGDQVIMNIQANAFVYHMVRNIIGALLEVGAGERPIEWIQTLLASKDRTQAGITALAQGLSLVAISYPSRYNIPSSFEEHNAHELV